MSVRLAVAIVLASVAIAAAALFGPRYLPHDGSWSIAHALDFRAFYCGGATMRSGADPYAVEPLGACERSISALAGAPLDAGFVMPAPLPPYALVALSLLARLPFEAAVCAWYAAMLLASIASIVLLHRLTRVPVIAIAAVAIACVLNGALLGQISPFVVFLECAAALALRAGRYRTCGVLAALTAVEPHLALPVLVSLLTFVPRVRLPAIATLAAMIVLSFAVAPPQLYGEYAFREIPAHSLSEVHALRIQYSLTSALATFAGFSDGAAVWFGRLDFACMLALGLFVAHRFARRWDASVLALLPPAFTALGGMFEHPHDLYVAVPAMLLAWRHGDALVRGCAFAAVAGVATTLVLEAWFANGFNHRASGAILAQLARGDDPNALASDVFRGWQRALKTVDAADVPAVLALRAPGLAGLALFIAASCRSAFVRVRPDAERFPMLARVPQTALRKYRSP